MLFNSIQKHAADKIALYDDSHIVTYGDLMEEIQKRAARLLDVSVLAIALDNGVEWVLWDLAALKVGVPCVPVPHFFTQAQVSHLLRSAGVSHLLSPQGLRDTSIEREEVLPQGTAKVTFTSGTTGTPKGVCLPRVAMENVAKSIVNVLGTDFVGTHVSVLPLSVLLENVAGVYAGLMAGCSICLSPLQVYGQDYKGLYDRLKEVDANSVILVPEILRILMAQVAEKGPLEYLDFIAVGGSKVDPALVLQAREMGLPVYEGYGLSECASVVSLNTPEYDKPGTVGRVLPHVQAQIINGEVQITVPGFLGYIGEDAPIHYKTGDLGKIDKDGFLSVTGRKKNVLITSYGRNISPEWVESALLLQPAIAQIVVYGDAQPYLSAFIVPSFDEADIQHAIDTANKALPGYAQIKDFRIVPPFTIKDGMLTGTGRPRRNKIITLYTEKEKEMNFYDRLVKETEGARQELYTVPQLADGMQGNISRETYIAYLTEAFHHVSHTVPFLMTMGARLPQSKKWLHKAIIEYQEEEVGHEEWILNDIEAAGGNKNTARQATPNLETQVLIAYNYDYIMRKNPVGFLGMVFMLESTSTQIANKGADAVKKTLGLPQEAFSYLYSHGELDISHMKFFEKTVNKIMDSDDQDAIIEVAQNTFRLFADVLRAIPYDGALKHAA